MVKLVIKGDFDTLAQYAVIQGVYAVLEQAIKLIDEQPMVNEKCEIIFTTKIPSLIGKEIKLVKNNTTKTITVIIK